MSEAGGGQHQGPKRGEQIGDEAERPQRFVPWPVVTGGRSRDPSGADGPLSSVSVPLSPGSGLGSPSTRLSIYSDQNAKDQKKRWTLEEVARFYADNLCKWGGVAVRMGVGFSLMSYETVRPQSCRCCRSPSSPCPA
jgi:hypothetical protein